MSCPVLYPPWVKLNTSYHSKNNTTTLILCPILTPCPTLAHHGWTLHINFQRPLHFIACRHDGLLGAGRTPLALHQVPILPMSNPLSFWKYWKLQHLLKSEPKGSLDCTILGRPNYGSLAKFSPTLPFMVSSLLSFSWALSWVNTAPLCCCMFSTSR